MGDGIRAFLLAIVASYGTFLLYTAVALGWRGVGVAPGLGQRRRSRRQALRELLVHAGFERLRIHELVGVEVVLFAVAAAVGYAVYGGPLTAIVAGGVAAALPVAGARGRRRTRRELARDAWPRMIEEVRLQVVSLGRSVPQALLDVGVHGPEQMRPAFLAAQREWSISTDLDRALAVLKGGLADPTADAVCETLLVAHEVGGTDVDARLRALIDDRTEDLQGRKDARSKQAGVRFARYFVLIVPFGMALVGLSIGGGRAAYASADGQSMVLVAFALMGACWVWAARLLRLPDEERVFTDGEVSL